MPSTCFNNIQLRGKRLNAAFAALHF